MSRYAYLVCEETKHVIWLGKIVVTESAGRFFQIGESGDVCNSDRRPLMKAIMKFLAQHLNKIVCVMSEEDYDSISDETFIKIGGDALPGISLEDYIKDFTG